jgi:cellulose biosynthesis protein BcsQ
MSERPKVITFVSGKGGAGKTTAAISIAKIVADMGLPSLLIDFDLATNGASYFFRPRFRNDAKGIWEILTQSSAEKPSVIDISHDFSFVPSRVGLGIRSDSFDAIRLTETHLKEAILTPLLTWATEKRFAYIFVDCQAGYTIATKAAVEVADSVVVVTEADSISSDAADNLLIQLGGSLPSERKFLVNKVDVRDAATYRNMREVFQTLNRLPPLPFDFTVRNAFGARRIPVDPDQPSPLLFALLQTLIALLPERFDAIESFKRTHVDALFERYDKEMEALLAE